MGPSEAPSGERPRPSSRTPPTAPIDIHKPGSPKVRYRKRDKNPRDSDYPAADGIRGKPFPFPTKLLESFEKKKPMSVGGKAGYDAWEESAKPSHAILEFDLRSRREPAPDVSIAVGSRYRAWASSRSVALTAVDHYIVEPEFWLDSAECGVPQDGILTGDILIGNQPQRTEPVLLNIHAVLEAHDYVGIDMAFAELEFNHHPYPKAAHATPEFKAHAEATLKRLPTRIRPLPTNMAPATTPRDMLHEERGSSGDDFFGDFSDLEVDDALSTSSAQSQSSSLDAVQFTWDEAARSARAANLRQLLGTDTQPTTPLPNTAPCELPDEIWVAILSELRSVESLRSAMSVSKQLLRCATSACLPIIKNTIGPTLPETIAAVESRRLMKRLAGTLTRRASIFHWCRRHVARRPAIPTRLSVRDAWRLEQMDRMASYFARRFVRASYRRLYKETVALSGQPVPLERKATAAEMARIKRMFCHFETYVNLYREPVQVRFDPNILRDQRVNFFDHFTPWEKEQFASVVEFLAADIVEPSLGYLLRRYEAGPAEAFGFSPTIDSRRATWLQYQFRTLSHGLKHLHIIATSPPLALAELAWKKPGEQPSADDGPADEAVGIHTWMLDALAKCLNPEPTGDTVEDSRGLSALTEAEYDAQFRDSLWAAQDRDQGPREGWWWAYKSLPRHKACYDVRMVNLRRMGLVFWDETLVSQVTFMRRTEVWRWRWAPERTEDWMWRLEEEPSEGAYWTLGDEGVVPDFFVDEDVVAVLPRRDDGTLEMLRFLTANQPDVEDLAGDWWKHEE